VQFDATARLHGILAAADPTGRTSLGFRGLIHSLAGLRSDIGCRVRTGGLVRKMPRQGRDLPRHGGQFSRLMPEAPAEPPRRPRRLALPGRLRPRVPVDFLASLSVANPFMELPTSSRAAFTTKAIHGSFAAKDSRRMRSSMACHAERLSCLWVILRSTPCYLASEVARVGDGCRSAEGLCRAEPAPAICVFRKRRHAMVVPPPVPAGRSSGQFASGGKNEPRIDHVD